MALDVISLDGSDGMSFARHAGTVWPFIQGFWAEAASRHHQLDVMTNEFEKLTTLACKYGDFRELHHPITGEPYEGIQSGYPIWNSYHRQTWSATAYVRMLLHAIIGIRLSPDGITLCPQLPTHLNRIEMRNITYRNQRLRVMIVRDETGQPNAPREPQGLFISNEELTTRGTDIRITV